MTWQDDKAWADRFMPEIKSILGRTLIGPAPYEEDAERNTDLIVLRMEAVRIACRIRRPDYIGFKDDFTIRAGRPGGTKTELAKIIEGWGDYFFYGIAAQDEVTLAFWLLGSLNAFRLWHNRYLFLHDGKLPGTRCSNVDGSSWFYACKWREIPNFLIAQLTEREIRQRTV